MAEKTQKSQAQCLKRSVKYPTSVMIWDCVFAQGAGSLCFLTPNTTVNIDIYIMHTCLIESWRISEEAFVFQHDCFHPLRQEKSNKTTIQRHWSGHPTLLI